MNYYNEPDLILEEDCYELDEETGELKIDKQVYDVFEKGSTIRVMFVDEGDYEPIINYRMVAEDKEYIYCEYLG